MTNFKDWKTTLPFILAALATAVLNEPATFPAWALPIAKIVMALGIALGGINASSSNTQPINVNIAGITKKDLS
jgi:hypothetical protein